MGRRRRHRQRCAFCRRVAGRVEAEAGEWMAAVARGRFDLGRRRSRRSRRKWSGDAQCIALCRRASQREERLLGPQFRRLSGEVKSQACLTIYY